MNVLFVLGIFGLHLFGYFGQVNNKTTISKILFIEKNARFIKTSFNPWSCNIEQENPIYFEETLCKDSIRELKNMEELVCERGPSYFEFEVDKENLVRIFEESVRFKKYWIYNKVGIEFHRIDIRIYYKNNSKLFPQLIRISKYMSRQIAKCDTGDKLVVRIKEFHSGKYYEIIKIITVN